MKKIQSGILILSILHLLAQYGWAIPEKEIERVQPLLVHQTTGERIAFWAAQFIGVPYDKDPLGEYVSKAAIVADERVDCMYLTFRATELALGRTPQEAVRIALDKRFHSKGILKDGKVLNYEDRFAYGEDMIFSGKWGKEITSEIGKTATIKGSRGKEVVEVLSTEVFVKEVEKIKSGDVVFFIKKPEKRVHDEIVGHIGIITVEQGNFYLIHASGTKGKGGEVKRVLLKDYLLSMPFLGAKITRFE